MSDESSEEESDRKIAIPRFVKNSLEEVDTQTIYINTSCSQYPILRQVANSLGWAVDTSSDSQGWDVFWTDSAIESEQLFRMHPFQKINHFPGMYVLARKNMLGKGLMKMRKQFPEEYNFFPLTWHLPSEFNDLSLYFESQPPTKTYIAKPQALSQGKGIFLTRKLAELEGHTCVVQTYIDKPYLIGGLKFDLRVYVLLAGCDPLRIYVYEEGLARFATQDYRKPKKSNLKHAYMHLTNYAINKLNPKFVFNKSSEDMDVGHKRSMTSVFKSMQEAGVDTSLLKEKINAAIVKTIITGRPLIAYMYRLSQPLNLANDMCFQVLGIDILIDEKAEPYLLEVNHTPSFTADTPLDKTIKKNLLVDTLVLMNINLESKKTKVTQIRENNELRAQGHRTKLTPEQRSSIRHQQTSQRDLYEQGHSKRFTKVYPSDDAALQAKYQKMVRYADMEFDEHIGIKKRVAGFSERVGLAGTSPVRKLKTKRAQSHQQPKQHGLVLPKLQRSELLHETSLARSMRQVVGARKVDALTAEISESLEHLQEQNRSSIETTFGKYIVPQTFKLHKYQRQFVLELDKRATKQNPTDRRLRKPANDSFL